MIREDYQQADICKGSKIKDNGEKESINKTITMEAFKTVALLTAL